MKMKKTKKLMERIGALLICLVLIMGMLPMRTIAANESIITKTGGTLTIHKTSDDKNDYLAGVVYTIYRIGEIKQETDSSGNITVYYKAIGTLKDTDGSAITIINADTDPDKIDVTSLNPAGTITTTATKAAATTLNLDNGVYLAVETTSYPNSRYTNNFIVTIPMSVNVYTNGSVTGSSWEYDIVATPKNTIVDATIKKEITSSTLDNPELTTTNDYTASRGETIDYKITSILSSSFTSTKYSTYTIRDLPDSALQIVFGTEFSGIVVQAADKLVDGKYNTLVRGTDYTIKYDYDNDTGATGFVIEFIMSYDTTKLGTDEAFSTYSSYLYGSAEVIVTYSAKLATDATAGTGYQNNVELDYEFYPSSATVDDDPLAPGPFNPDPSNPEPIITTYSYMLQKIEAENSDPLAGAVFVIANAYNTSTKVYTYMKWNATSGWSETTDISEAYKATSTVANSANAIVKFEGLAAGTYYIIETQAPDKYSLLEKPIEVTIGIASTADSTNTDTGYSIQVVNKLNNIFELPATGGIGTYIFIVGGAVLIAMAIILFMKKQKK